MTLYQKKCKNDLQLLKNWINFPFAASLAVLRSALEWKPWFTKLWSENIFRHVIFICHSYDRSTSQTNRPRCSTIKLNKLRLFFQYFPPCFFSRFQWLSTGSFEAVVSFSNPPKVPKFELRTQNLRVFTPVKYLMLFWGVFDLWSQYQNKGVALVIFTSCRFEI